MSERLDVSSAVETTLVKGCPKCGNQSFRVEYADFNHRLICGKCGEWAWLQDWPWSAGSTVEVTVAFPTAES